MKIRISSKESSGISFKKIDVYIVNDVPQNQSHNNYLVLRCVIKENENLV